MAPSRWRNWAALCLLAFSAQAASAKDLFVVCQDEATLIRFDAERAEVSARVGLPPKPAMIAASRQGQLLFITHPESGRISRLQTARLDAPRSLEVGGTPFGIRELGPAQIGACEVRRKEICFSQAQT